MITLTKPQRLFLRRASHAPVIPRGKQRDMARVLIEAGYLVAHDGAVSTTEAGRQAIEFDKLVGDNGY